MEYKKILHRREAAVTSDRLVPVPRSLLAAFPLALLAQFLLSRGNSWADGLLLYGVALLLLFRGLRQPPSEQQATDMAPPAADAERQTGPVGSPGAVDAREPGGTVSGSLGSPTGAGPARRWARQARLLVGFLAVSAFLGFGSNSVGALPLAALLGAAGAYIYLFWEPTPSAWRPLDQLKSLASQRGLSLRLSWHATLLVGIVTLGAVLRFVQLDEIPAEMISDHAEKYLDIEAIRQGARPIFFPTNAGREGTQFYLAAMLTNLTGYTYLTLKLVTCTASVVTIPFVYLFGRTIYGPAVGLTAAFLLAISQWDISAARLATRATLGTLWSTIALFLAYRALVRGERNTFLLLGLAMGLGLYGYTSFRIVPVFVAFLVVAFIALRSGSVGQRRATVKNATVAYGLTALLAIPLARYAIDFPQLFLYRTASRLTESEREIVGGAFPVLLENLWNTALMFTWQGDRSWVQQVPGDPMLDWVAGGLFVLGLGYAAHRTVTQRDVVAATLAAGVLILTLPSALALAFPIEHPHQNRANAVLPVVMVLAALPTKLAMDRLVPPRGRPARFLAAAGAVALAGLALQANVQSYFVEYREVHRLNTPNQREIGAVVRGFADLVGSSRNAYLPTWPHWVDHRILALEAGDFGWRETALLPRAEDASAHVGQPGPKLYILHRDDAHSLEVLRRVYPQALVREHASAKPGRAFRTVFVPG